MGRDFRKIKAWQAADLLVLEIYKITKGFPQEELYGLTSQLRRAGTSIPTNIAEGANRESKKEYTHFLSIAKGSTGEVEYLLYLANKLQLIEMKDFERLNSMATEVAKTLYGLLIAVKKEIQEGVG